MHIFFNGDSNMSGEELLPGEKNMSDYIAEHYGATSTSMALAGCCNDRIYDTTIEYLAKHRPDMVVIGWTEHSRQQWYHDGKFREVTHLGIGEPLPEEYQGRHSFWKQNIKRNSDWHRTVGYYWHNKIYNLHTMLREKKIPHVFFNIFYDFLQPDPAGHLDWHNSHVAPYDIKKCYINWCTRKGFKEITPGTGHFPTEAHQAWANLLIDFVKNNPQP